MMEKSVCVIGAGPSGITAIKNIHEKGIAVKAYDYNHDVGGTGFFLKRKVIPAFLKLPILLVRRPFRNMKIFPSLQKLPIIPLIKNCGIIFRLTPKNSIYIH